MKNLRRNIEFELENELNDQLEELLMCGVPNQEEIYFAILEFAKYQPPETLTLENYTRYKIPRKIKLRKLLDSSEYLIGGCVSRTI